MERDRAKKAAGLLQEIEKLDGLISMVISMDNHNVTVTSNNRFKNPDKEELIIRLDSSTSHIVYKALETHYKAVRLVKQDELDRL